MGEMEEKWEREGKRGKEGGTQKRRLSRAERYPQTLSLASDPLGSEVRRRWHAAQSSPYIDTADKARARAFGDATVSCVCGCDREFPAAVQPSPTAGQMYADARRRL